MYAWTVHVLFFKFSSRLEVIEGRGAWFGLCLLRPSSQHRWLLGVISLVRLFRVYIGD